jgi:hypothetical protein
MNEIKKDTYKPFYFWRTFYKIIYPKSIYVISTKMQYEAKIEEVKNPMVKTDGSFAPEDMKNVQISIRAVVKEEEERDQFMGPFHGPLRDWKGSIAQLPFAAGKGIKSEESRMPEINVGILLAIALAYLILAIAYFLLALPRIGLILK